MNIQVRHVNDCQDDLHYQASPEHRVAMAMQSVRGGIAELTVLLREPASRPAMLNELADLAGAELALALIRRAITKTTE